MSALAKLTVGSKPEYVGAWPGELSVDEFPHGHKKLSTWREMGIANVVRQLSDLSTAKLVLVSISRYALRHHISASSLEHHSES